MEAAACNATSLALTWQTPKGPATATTAATPTPAAIAAAVTAAPFVERLCLEGYGSMADVCIAFMHAAAGRLASLSIIQDPHCWGEVELAALAACSRLTELTYYVDSSGDDEGR